MFCSIKDLGCILYIQLSIMLNFSQGTFSPKKWDDHTKASSKTTGLRQKRQVKSCVASVAQKGLQFTSLLPADKGTTGSNKKGNAKDWKRFNSPSEKASVPWSRTSARPGVMADTEDWTFLSD